MERACGDSHSAVANKLRLYDSAMDQIKGSLLDLVPLYMKYANLAKINAKCSRHNTPSHCHTLSKFVKCHSTGKDEYVVVM
ncbi:hypothetical protein AVEN_168494-1 [Araneus ventricosus]|uniref:Probable aminopeptidase NPEPL1 N-terminal domain-containing protein n=1 Tax=Araneus ventricosus TaxID=182803 RepID=A0A4Y2M3P7_ARAVE|nr:hypothetical protein AVEN_168494-1 [Araneus ventricosus]